MRGWRKDLSAGDLRSGDEKDTKCPRLSGRLSSLGPSVGKPLWGGQGMKSGGGAALLAAGTRGCLGIHEKARQRMSPLSHPSRSETKVQVPQAQSP